MINQQQFDTDVTTEQAANATWAAAKALVATAEAAIESAAAQKGMVEVLGGDMKSAYHRRTVCPRTAYMPQGLGRNLYTTLSVFENVDFFGRLFGQSRSE